LKDKKEYKPNPPFRVDAVDQFEGHGEDGYGEVGLFFGLEDAIKSPGR
jgi:hypothetical protein